MMELDINVTRATLIPPRESLTPGMLNAVQLHFNFSDEWNGLEKVCVFSNEIDTAPAVVENDTVSVPDTILGAVYRWISVGVTGEDGDGSVIIPTIWCRIGQVLPGAGGASSKFVTVDMLEDYWSKAEIDLQTEGDGTKFLGDDGQYHEVAQGGGDVTHQELEDALALKADKTEVEALSATVDDKADKSEIITVTSGDGTKFLADDGTYKPVSGSSDAVTHDELDAAVAPLATKSEVDAAVAPLATKDELSNATASLATTTAMNAALALKADKTELNSYAKQYDVNQALDSKADKVATQTALDAKADKTELADYAKTSDVSSTYATKTEVAGKADKSEIITVTTGTGTLFLADDGTYRPASGDPPDLTPYLKKDEASATYATKSELPDTSDMLTKTEASTTYATKTELGDKADASAVTALDTRVTATEGAITSLQTDKADASALANYETTAHAEATYATKSELPDTSDMLTKTEAASTYAEKSELPDTSDMLTKTEAGTTYATKSELPDVSDMLTKTEATGTYATQTDLSTKADKTELEDYAEKSDIITVTTGDGTQFLADDGTYKQVQTDLSSYLTKTEAEQTYATQTQVNDKADKSEIITVTTGTGTLFLADDGTYRPASGDPPDLTPYLKKDEASTTYETQTHASATYATKSELPDTSDMLTKTEAASTYADKSEIPDTSDMLTKTEAGTTYATKTELASKADASALADYETTAHAEATYATKSELPDVSDMLTKTEASFTYATQAALADKADSSTVTALAGTVAANTAEIATLQTGKADKSELPDVSDMLTKTEAASTYAEKSEIPDTSDMLTKTEAGTTYATKTELASKADASALADYETTAHAEATYATKSELPDVSDMLTKTEAGTTYLTQTDAASTYATQSALADKADASAISDMLTKTEAASTYETKADASQIKSIKSGANSAVVDANGEAQVGVTTVTKTETSNGSTGATGYEYIVQQTLPDGTTSDEFKVKYAIFPDPDNRDYGVFYVCGRQTVSVPELNFKLQSYATKTEITDMATQTWVQQYIASLDGTNMSV